MSYGYHKEPSLRTLYGFFVGCLAIAFLCGWWASSVTR